MRILGIDPGLRRTGFGVIEQRGSELSYVASGVIRVPDGELAPRLRTIHSGITEIIENWRPDLASVEIVFVNVNPQATLALGQARGAAIAAIAIRDVPVHEYTALQVKQSVVGYGRASKEQIQSMVRRLLQLASDPSADAADALACAICHAHASTLAKQLGGAGLLAAAARSGARSRRGRLRGRQ
ncbi:MAG: crossover junction endodeoxyribonuclease RuvC [Betaproteobacteria bacterium]|jgi:crossover junction endodeoxyribonuclease RuvC